MLFYFLLCLACALATTFSDKANISRTGYRTEVVEGRVAGGKPVTEDYDFEYQIQLFIGEEFCSGIIVNKYYLVTAAHCVYKTAPDDIVAFVGSKTFGIGDYVEIAEIVVHPEYDYPQMDVAYLGTVSAIDLNKRYVGNAYVNDDGKPLPNTATVSGWGNQGNGVTVSDQLMYADLSIIDRTRCQEMYPDVTITEAMICAENTAEGGQGDCLGDDGGPLATELFDSLETTFHSRVIGIHSFTRGCGPGMGPSVFTFLETREILDFIINGTVYEE